jgi:hypothetical protein
VDEDQEERLFLFHFGGGKVLKLYSRKSAYMAHVYPTVTWLGFEVRGAGLETREAHARGASSMTAVALPRGRRSKVVAHGHPQETVVE